jgi:hypothetical protein
MDGFITLLTGGHGLAGVDKTRPWCIVNSSDGTEIDYRQFDRKTYMFLPVTDPKQLMSRVGDLTGQSLAPDADGVYQFKGFGSVTNYMMARGGWASWAYDRDVLKSLPADPAALLGDLPKRYTLAGRIPVKNLSHAIRKMLIDQLQEYVRSVVDQGDFAAVVAFGELSSPGVKAVVNDLDEVLLGVTLDKSSNALRLDCRMTAVPGSQTARRFGQLRPATGNFAGFIWPDASVAFNQVYTLADDDVARARSGLHQLRAKAMKELEQCDSFSKEQAQAGKQLLGDVADVLEKTLEGRKLDLGGALLLKPRGSVIVAGGLVADGDKLDKALRILFKEIGKEDPDFARSVKLDAETVDGVHFHTATLPVSAEDWAMMFGDKADVVVGVGADRFYAAVGRDALTVLKEAIAKSKAAAGKMLPPLRFSAAITPLAKFLAFVSAGTPDGQEAAAGGGVLEQSGGLDHVTITVLPAPNGVNIRLEEEQGLLKLIGKRPHPSH